MTDRLKPKVVRNGSGESVIHLGPVLHSLIAASILAIFGGLGTVGVLVWRTDQAEEKIALATLQLDRQGRNQVQIDFGLRENSRDIEWANRKLDLLFDRYEMKERAKRPPLPKSNLEEIH